ncbi:MAG: DUF1127 domain-containing protein [Boseongicola sp. SB0676_bin_33]|nr:DUF1127 domain-containing protein [Boseongicola sp. SB0676_bin_33]MYK32353.1 DUF1127 domain-containing protein [Boseongicola sp. SB0670_bin_30]
MAITMNRSNAANVSGTPLTLSGLVSGVVHWNKARRTRAVLSRLSTHELDDIGISRGDIDSICFGRR